MRIRRRATVAAVAAVLTLAVAAPPASAENAGTTQGCTPGYWKVQQHWDSWQETKPWHPLVAMFSEASGYPSIAGLTQAQALNVGGGPGAEGAARILVRAGVAAWLNAAYDDPAGGDALQFPWRRYSNGKEGRPPLVDTVNAALASGDRATMLDLAAWLDTDNNLGCPLN